MKRKTLTSLLLLALTVGARADEPSAGLSLAQAVEEGIGKSPTVKKYEDAREEASWGRLLGESTLLPHVEIGAHRNFVTQYQSVPTTLGPATVAIPIVFPQTAAGARAEWTIFDGLANLRTFEASSTLLRSATLESSRKAFEVRKRIELAFFRALAARRFEEVAEKNVKMLEESLAQVRNRMESGVATQYDVLRVEVQLSDAQTELEKSQDDVVIERKNLASVMGAADDARPLIGELPIPSSAAQIHDLPPPVRAQREDLEAARLRSEAEDKEASAAAGALAPSLALSAAYEKYEDNDYPGQAYGGFRDSWNVGVVLKWRIFDGGETIARAGAARARAMHAEAEYQEGLLTLPTDYERWKRRYVYSEHRFTSSREDVKRSEESYRISFLAFQEGRKTITDVLEAQTDLFRARAGVVQSQLDAEESRVKLELTVGKEISL